MIRNPLNDCTYCLTTNKMCYSSVNKTWLECYLLHPTCIVDHVLPDISPFMRELSSLVFTETGTENGESGTEYLEKNKNTRMKKCTTVYVDYSFNVPPNIWHTLVRVKRNRPGFHTNHFHFSNIAKSYYFSGFIKF